MKPYFSESDKETIVRNFLSLRGQGKAPISDFGPIAIYLNEKSIKQLHKVNPTSHPYRRGYTTEYAVYFDKADAEEYFNWIIAILTGVEKASEDVIKEASDQLFLFVFALRDKMNIGLDSFLKVSFEWEN
jgi:hypothetical protein